jgi:DNA invertase Pin-like site-specific DNA recombinase
VICICTGRRSIPARHPGGRCFKCRVAEFEQEIIRERCAGLARARANGVKLGRQVSSKVEEASARSDGFEC